MMKKTILIFLSLFMLLVFSSFVSAGDVTISPSNPDTSDDLKCFVSGEENTVFDFYWMKNGAEYLSSQSTYLTLDSSITEGGDTWTCEVWTPASAYYDADYYGSESVTVSGSPDIGSDGNVVIDPAEPYTEDDLTCYVEGYEDVVFDFFWLKDGAEYLSVQGTSSVLDASFTEVGDVWTCDVWTPASAYYDADHYGWATVEVLADEDDTPWWDWELEPYNPFDFGSAPLVSNAGYTVDEGETVVMTIEVVESYFDYLVKATGSKVFGNEVIYVYDADGDTVNFDIDGVFDGAVFTTFNQEYVLNTDVPRIYTASWKTSVGDAGVYVDTVSVWDEIHEYMPTEALFTITVNEASTTGNVCPTIEPVDDITVYEGDLVSVELDARDSDGDLLAFTWEGIVGSAQGPNYEWQTADGDAGVYDVDVTVDDGECDVKVEFTITVLADGLGAENNAPVLDTIADIEVDEGAFIEIVASATDEDGDVLSFSFEGLDAGDALGDTWTWQTGFEDAGQYYLTVSVTDGELSDSQEVSVKVNDVIGGGEEPYVPSNYEGDLLEVTEVNVLNAADLGSWYCFDADVDVTGSYEYSNGCLSNSAMDNEIVVFVEMHNRNSFDARDIQLTFIFNDQKSYGSFVDLDRSEQDGALYRVSVPNDLETGSYGLKVIIENDNLYEERVFNLDVVSVGDAVEYEEGFTEDVSNLWDRIVNFFSSLF
tara:strand:- start:5709 stop:7832 length:2124 start_codon:yes stop_codon:yes gene_type:complete